MANEVMTPQDTSVAAFDYGEFAHEGFENTSIADLSIPFIAVMQSNSPQVEAGECKAGDLYNTVTKEILRQPLVLQPIYTEVVWVEWVPRLKGGGLVERHAPDSDVVKRVLAANGGSRIPPKDAVEGKRKPFRTDAGNDIVETHYVYCYLMNEEGTEVEGYCVLSFSSTKVKVKKNWLSAMYQLKGAPPLYANRAKVSTEREKNDVGQTYYNFKIAPFAATWRDSLINPNTHKNLLDDAKQFREMILSGLARVDTSGLTHDADSSGGHESSRGDDEIPF